MKTKLFGSSGIRGLANIEITVTLAQRVGTALATQSPGGTIITGRDARLTGPMLETALQAGIASAGADTYTIGLVPTPITAWMIKEAQADAGVEVTASHNPPQYNGLKVFNRQGMSLTLKEQLEIESILENESYNLSTWDTVGSVQELDGVEPYTDALLDQLNINKEWKIASDLFCGATCTAAPSIYNDFNINSLTINGSPNGRFPAGNPEPTLKTLQPLGTMIKNKGLEIGFGYDGDGDRMMLVDGNGAMVSPDRVLAAYAGYVVEQNGGGVVVTHVGASMNVDDMVNKAGGKVIRTPVGDAFITEAMAEHKAVFGGEPVGAWVHPDIHMCPDGILSALKLLEALEETDQTIEEFIHQAPEYPIERVKLECPNEAKVSALNAVSEQYQENFKKVDSISTVDGVRLELEKGWVLIRPSGTEPLIRITVEGRTGKDVMDLMEKGKSLVKNVLGGLK